MLTVVTVAIQFCVYEVGTLQSCSHLGSFLGVISATLHGVSGIINGACGTLGARSAGATQLWTFPVTLDWLDWQERFSA